MNCLICKKHVNIAERIKCWTCKGVYHHLCLNITKEYYAANAQRYDSTWKCPECLTVTKRPKVTQQKDITKKVSTPRRSQPLTGFDLDETDDTVFGDTQNNSNLESVNLEQLSSLLDQKLNTMKDSIVTLITAAIEDKISLTLQKFKQDFIQELSCLKSQQQEILTTVEEMDKKIQILENAKENLEKEIKEMSTKLPSVMPYENNHQCEKQKKFVLYGLEETYDEDEYNLNYRIINVFKDLFNVDLTGYIEDSTRIGKRGNRRPLIVELISKNMTKYILHNVAYLRNTGLYISEYLDENGRNNRKKAQEILKNARKNGRHAIIRNNKIIIDGKEYKHKSDKEIPENTNYDKYNSNNQDFNNTFRN